MEIEPSINQQISQTYPIDKRKNYPLIIISILLTAIITGLIVFFLQNSKIEVMKNKYEAQVSELQNSLEKSQLDNEQTRIQINTIEKELEEVKDYKAIVEENNKKNICLDSDGGQDYFTKGTIKYQKYDNNGNVTATSDAGDSCVNAIVGGENKENVLREYYCTNNQVQYEHFVCPNGCLNGICVQQ